MAQERNGDGSQADSPEAEIESLELAPEELEAFKEAGQFLSELDATPLSQYMEELHFGEANQLFEFFLKALGDRRWAFRGQSDSNWMLRPSAERLCKSRTVRSVEKYILAAFKRRAHQYLTDLPHTDDALEWLALAQHFGAPTNLLDFTTSPYVAAFFAATEQSEGKSAAVWAIDIEVLKLEALERLSSADEFFKTTNGPLGSPEVFNKLFPEVRGGATIVPLQPVRMNERLTVQQGLFLYPTSFWDFELALKLTLHSWCGRMNVATPCHNHMYKLVIEPEARLGVLKELNRMNVTYASLFPGLEGFARSLRTDIFIRDSEGYQFGGPDYGDMI